MKNLYDLAEVNFVNLDIEKIEEEATELLEEKLDKSLYPSSPERILMLSLLSIILQQRADINEKGKQNLLAYSSGDFLEHMGAFVGESRANATYSMTTLCFQLSAPLSFVHLIPKGTEVTADGMVYFETIENKEIPIGELNAEVLAQCKDPGLIGNGFIPGQINQLVNPIPFIEKVENITETFGGLDTESDEQLRQKIHEAPEGFSTAGPDGAYKYWARTANSLITHIEVHSPKEGIVTIYPLLKDGQLPTKEIIDQIYEVCNDRKIRPLTDKVEVKPPVEHEIQLDVEYWISGDKKPFVSQIQKNIEEAIQMYKEWQTYSLGRDINPDKITELLMQAGAKRLKINSPNFKVLKKYEKATIVDSNISYKGVEDD